ncbi:MAG TPA: helicase HerA-like domain-containing protein [Myxococcota bacterium]|nr:helicase HerA-like domain-containing protein [Myxococcota bacterium]
MKKRLCIGASDEGPLEVDPEDFRTHGVVVGMTGSGKTGLCLVLLEEMVRAGVPIIAIDPKGDLGNLSLVFPELAPEDFAPWADGQDPAELATRWREGLASFDLGSEDLLDLRDKLDLTLYTPGSEAGEPVDVLAALAAPSDVSDGEALRGLVGDTVSGLLGLVGRTADPVRDPAHIVLSTIIEQAWQQGEDLDIEALITHIVDPPFEKVGVFPTDRFYPPDDRMDLAMLLNGVIASPSFASWTHGSPLDVEDMLSGGVHVFCLSHLSESERQFFVSLLLGRVVAWTRTQPGTERLRALVFLDEAAGYLPPHPRTPPTKGPVLTLMKQARAVGLGVLLATQNPVDLDYKALSNAGLWFVGRLRTEQDRRRLLKGLPDPDVDLGELPRRHFLMARAKGGTATFGTRWAMCYLRGPFTKREIQAQRAPREPIVPPVIESLPDQKWRLPEVPPPVSVTQKCLDPRVVFSARLGPEFAVFAEPARQDGRVVLRPALHAELSLHFEQARHGFVLDHSEHRVLFPLPEAGFSDEFVRPRLRDEDLVEAPEDGLFASVPDWIDEAREWKAARAALVEAVYRSETRGMFVNPTLRLYGRAGETSEQFAERCRLAIRDRIDAKVAKLEASTRRKVEAVEKRIRARQRTLTEREGQLSSRRAEEAVNAGETLLSIFSARRRSVSRVVSKRSRTSEAKARVQKVADEIEELRAELGDIAIDLQDRIAAIEEVELAAVEDTEEREVRLRKKDIRVVQLGLLWIPVTRRIGR